MAFGLRQKILDRETRKVNMPNKGDALRRLADFVDDNDELFEKIDFDQQVHLGAWTHSNPKRTLVEMARAAANDRFCVEVKKDYNGDFFSLFLDFDGAKIELWTNRKEVCERRVVGTQTVTKKVAIEFEEQDVEEEIVEWDCHPLLKS